MYFSKSNGAYQACQILHEAKPGRPLSEKNADGYLSFVDSPISWCMLLTQVGALPHPTLRGYSERTREQKTNGLRRQNALSAYSYPVLPYKCT